MTNRIADLSQHKAARVAGFLYLGVIVFGIFAQLIREDLIVLDDAVKTAGNIMDSESLYRASFISDLLMITCFLLLPLALYVVLKPVNKNLASLMVILVLASVPIMFVNMLFHFSALLLLSGADYLTAFGADQLNVLTLFLLELYEVGVWIATIFHGLWLLPLGYLVYKSGYFPKLLGTFLMIGCFGFVIESFNFFVLPSDFEVITYPGIVFEILGEFGFCLWLVFKGAKIPANETV